MVAICGDQTHDTIEWFSEPPPLLTINLEKGDEKLIWSCFFMIVFSKHGIV